MNDFTFYLALTVLTVASCLALTALIRGKVGEERVAALDYLSLCTISILLVAGLRIESTHVIELSVVWLLITFVGMVVLIASKALDSWS